MNEAWPWGKGAREGTGGWGEAQGVGGKGRFQEVTEASEQSRGTGRPRGGGGQEAGRREFNCRWRLAGIISVNSGKNNHCIV